MLTSPLSLSLRNCAAPLLYCKSSETRARCYTSAAQMSLLVAKSKMKSIAGQSTSGTQRGYHFHDLTD